MQDEVDTDQAGLDRHSLAGELPSDPYLLPSNGNTAARWNNDLELDRSVPALEECGIGEWRHY